MGISTAKVREKLPRKVANLTSSIVTKADRFLNANHRHDEEHEIEKDKEREHDKRQNRFSSFCPVIDGNSAKWHVCGHDYMLALADALEAAQDEIMILDWWLSPELYMKRPPALNEQWRLDHILERAAKRGVKIYIILYKEVESALPLKSVHTKHYLEKLHENIAVMRHPNHTIAEGVNITLYWAHHEKMCVVDRRYGFIGGIDLCFGRWDLHHHPIADFDPQASSLAIVFPRNTARKRTLTDKLLNKNKAKDKLETGTTKSLGPEVDGESVEDGEDGEEGEGEGEEEGKEGEGENGEDGVAKKTEEDGGKDETDGENSTEQTGNSEDSRPTRELFWGQDYNSARIRDFESVDRPYNTQTIDRRVYPRMGWHDVAFQIQGPTVDYLVRHFVERWEFLREFKYSARKKYISLANPDRVALKLEHLKEKYRELRYGNPNPESSRAPDLKGSMKDKLDELKEKMHKLKTGEGRNSAEYDKLDEKDTVDDDKDNAEQEKLRDDVDDPSTLDKIRNDNRHHPDEVHPMGEEHEVVGSAKIQVVRSIGDWSHGFLKERSIQNAYIELISTAKHSVYIENQFFIAGSHQMADLPFDNEIGDALVMRILVAARSKQKFRVVIVIPAVPGFAGDLQSDEAIGTRAIMSFQYASISRGGLSIRERIAAEGFNPDDYIQFFSLRSFDRINFNGTQWGCPDALETGAQFTKASFDYEVPVDAGDISAWRKKGITPEAPGGDTISVAHSVLVDEPKLSDSEAFPWSEKPQDLKQETFSYVTEQLYIHSKLLIVDDTTVLCGSANINDRSQDGDHDSEIAIVYENPDDMMDATVGGSQGKVSKTAASLRRFLIRKHLGYIKPQLVYEAKTAEEAAKLSYKAAVSQDSYDFGSEYDKLVEDALSDEYWDLLHSVAQGNERVYEKLFHTVPSNSLTTWAQYKTWLDQVPVCGHVVNSLLTGDWNDTVKSELDKIQGYLVPFAYDFLKDEAEIVPKGLTYNSATENLFT